MDIFYSQQFHCFYGVLSQKRGLTCDLTYLVLWVWCVTLPVFFLYFPCTWGYLSNHIHWIHSFSCFIKIKSHLLPSIRGRDNFHCSLKVTSCLELFIFGQKLERSIANVKISSWLSSFFNNVIECEKRVLSVFLGKLICASLEVDPL